MTKIETMIAPHPGKPLPRMAIIGRENIHSVGRTCDDLYVRLIVGDGPSHGPDFVFEGAAELHYQGIIKALSPAAYLILAIQPNYPGRQL